MASLKISIYTTLALILIGFTSPVFSQGKVEVVKDFEFDLLINQKRIKADSMVKTGYRIQIYFGTDMEEANQAANKFKSLFPDLSSQVYITYTQPYWRVRVGNYYRPIDAQPDMNRYKSDFDSIFLIKDEIELPPIPLRI